MGHTASTPKGHEWQSLEVETSSLYYNSLFTLHIKSCQKFKWESNSANVLQMPTCLGHNLHSTDPWVPKTIKRISGKRPWKSIYMVILNVRSQIRGFQVGSALPGRSTLHQREVGLNIIHFRQDIDGIICYFLFDFQLFQVRLAQVSCGIVAGFPSCSTHPPSYYSPSYFSPSYSPFFICGFIFIVFKSAWVTRPAPSYNPSNPIPS